MTAKKKPEEEVKNKTLWEKLSRVDVTGKIQEKNGLSYLSWAWAWGSDQPTLESSNPDPSMIPALPFLTPPSLHKVPTMA